MGTIHINKLKPGMVLDEEVRDINGRLLLKKGKNIQSAHIRIFRIWGVTEVNICGNNGSKNTPDGNVNPEEIEKIKEYTHNLFCHADLEHPALKEIFRISVQFRSKHSFPQEEIKADLGRLILYSYFPEEARNLFDRARSTNMLLYLQENDSLGCNHTHIVKQLLQQWKLPMVLENNVFYHHDPSVASQPVPATLVHLADIITNSLGIGTSGERFVPPLDTEAWDGLGLSPTCFDIVVKQATHQFFALESMLEI